MLPVVTGAAAVAVLIGGCTSDPSKPTEEQQCLAAGGSYTRDGGEATFTCTLPQSDADAGLGSDAPASPTWDATAQAGAEDAALQAMQAYVNHTGTAEQWYERLAGYLTPAGQVDAYGTDPANIAAQVPLDATAVEGGSPYLAAVTVPTDVGDYAVLVVREGADRPWKVERITPPEGLG